MGNYVTIYEEYRHKFYQLPKVFFTNDRYKNMSNNAKVAWAILRDRTSLSRKNKWFDSDTGRVYFIFKNKELMEILNIKSETTLVRIKKELEEAELIEQERMGFNRPNKMYLLYPVVEEEDIYEIDKTENYQAEPIEDKKTAESIEGQGTPINGAPNNEVPYPQKMLPSNTELRDTDLKDLDTLDTKDTKNLFPNNENINSFNSSSKDKEKERLQKKEEYINKAFYENEQAIPKELADMLKVFSESTIEAEKYYNIILTAKNKVSNNTGQVIWLEHEPEITQKVINTFARSIRKIEKESVGNPNGYLYQAIYTLLEAEISERIRHIKGNNNENTIYYDWLNEN